jgi:hypothetical protein
MRAKHGHNEEKYQMEVKRIAIALCILIATTAIGSASAAEMPKELRGTWWCADRAGRSTRTHSPWPAGNYKRCHNVTDADDAFGIDASGREWGHDMTDDTCKVLLVTSYGKGHFVVRARCNNDEETNARVLLRWRLFDSGLRLEIRNAAKAHDLTMLEDRFGLPVFQTGPNNKALWWTWRILTKQNQIGEAIFARPEECKKYNHLASDPETTHIWCAANVPPYCEDLSKKIDGIAEITSAEAKRIGRSIITKMTPPKGFECLGVEDMDGVLTWQPTRSRW